MAKLTVYLPDELRDRLTDQRSSQRVNVSRVLRDALEAELNRMDSEGEKQR